MVAFTVYTGDSKDPVSGRTVAVLDVPTFQNSTEKSITDHISVCSRIKCHDGSTPVGKGC